MFYVANNFTMYIKYVNMISSSNTLFWRLAKSVSSEQKALLESVCQTTLQKKASNGSADGIY